jgi:hypothetical protein
MISRPVGKQPGREDVCTLTVYRSLRKTFVSITMKHAVMCADGTLCPSCNDKVCLVTTAIVKVLLHPPGEAIGDGFNVFVADYRHPSYPCGHQSTREYRVTT